MSLCEYLPQSKYFNLDISLLTCVTVGNIPKVWRLFANGLDPQIATMIYSMEKVPDLLKTWMNKAIDFY